ncbi:LacI family DNA-binding transcriptional regulator [Streptomyces sparsogenes]|uniref:LacI family DNA-binding transcriptional regulator n=1 Tax=Streptomyces sparsogenes TaxID=67365 RepID=UPI0033E7B8AE
MADGARPVTLQSMAKELGLHVSTVSRILNGPAATGARAASTATADRVRRLAAELGYRPDPHATGLRTRRSNLIGVLVPRMSDLVLAMIHEGIEEAATAKGLSTIVVNTLDRPETRRARTDMLIARRTDGLIFGDARVEDDFLAEVAARGTPFVLVNRHSADHPSVTCDDWLGGRLAADHLLGLGHRDLAIIAGEPHASTGVDRVGGFLERCAEAGVPVPGDRIAHGGFDTAAGRAAADRLLAADPAPTAIFAVNDFAAIGALGAARDRGLRVGEDLAVMGYNDTPLAAELPLPLTSVLSSTHEMGRRALAMLVRILAGERPPSERLRPVLTARASTGC